LMMSVGFTTVGLGSMIEVAVITHCLEMS